MSDVSKHNPEQKWEGDSGEEGRVGLFIARNSVGLDNFLS